MVSCTSTESESAIELKFHHVGGYMPTRYSLSAAFGPSGEFLGVPTLRGRAISGHIGCNSRH